MLFILFSKIFNDKKEIICSSPYVSIIFDESPDIAQRKILTMIIRFYNCVNSCVQNFIACYDEIDTCDGITVYEKILSTLELFSLDFDKVMFCCSDGAAYITSENVGVI